MMAGSRRALPLPHRSLGRFAPLAKYKTCCVRVTGQVAQLSTISNVRTGLPKECWLSETDSPGRPFSFPPPSLQLLSTYLTFSLALPSFRFLALFSSLSKHY
jgi:hypothetical protein